MMLSIDFYRTHVPSEDVVLRGNREICGVGVLKGQRVRVLLLDVSMAKVQPTVEPVLVLKGHAEGSERYDE